MLVNNVEPKIFTLSKAGAVLGAKISQLLNGQLIGLQSRVSDADILTTSIGDEIRKAFKAGHPIIAVMASGALIRILGPLLNDKHNEPAVIAISEDGASVVPLLGGHHGANDLAKKIADLTSGHAAITTAGDLRFGIALDHPPKGYVLANPENAKDVMAALLAGEKAKLVGVSDWIENSKIELSDSGKVRLIIADKKVETSALDLVYYRENLMLGMGCERGAETSEAIELVEQILNENNLSPNQLAGLYSIDVKADETALHEVADYFKIPVRFFKAETLEREAPRLKNPSEYVFNEVGCHGVAEGAALAAAGQNSDLIIPKEKSKRVTLAIAKKSDGQVPNMQETENRTMSEKPRKRGKLFVVGIGPGQETWRSPEVSRMIGEATDLVGYSLYLDLIAQISEGKVRHDFDLGKEEDRVRHSMELAGEGKDVALVCSGDAGIYAMATLVFELLKNGGLSDAANRIEIVVSPGISALQAAAARAGAPLGHDFCTISLSDLLTPWDAIKMRVKAAAEGDFVIAFYNPVSKRRRTQLAYAKNVLLEHRPKDTPVILATNLGRPEEKVRVVPLEELNIDDVDMLTVVVVGSSETQTVKTGDGKTWVYTPRGYSAKVGTNINSKGETKI
ncbi:MAG: precorrin-3B C(17)-methyltransferase [Hyphomicrobiales bacterium]|nr:precorrin-3B C(17)-methyltransferase [Hyphomicrobiales bacterium]PCH51710.1 MAG: precorrin-3B C(17)-methyltransferase [Hyphomicrobiales bacterium]